MAATIRVLPENLINQIAAGEVVERPAAAVKELVENAIDAGARRIAVSIRDGGRTEIVVEDDGCGMSREDIALCLVRHATSKLPDEDLWAISTLGFRGEALASIGSVARVRITSRREADDHGWTVGCEGGAIEPVRPAPRPRGTTVEVRDLFFATPARLKFLRSERTEGEAIKETLEGLALANAGIEFVFVRDGGRPITWRARTGPDARRQRVGDILGAEFAANSVAVATDGETIRVEGFAGLPSYGRPTGREQLVFVNGRHVRDKVLLGALRGAYQDVMPRDRHPAACLFVQVADREVDVNVHPAKAEVRFVEPQRVRGTVVAAIRSALAEARAATTVTGDAALAAFRPAPVRPAPTATLPFPPVRPAPARFDPGTVADFAHLFRDVAAPPPSPRETPRTAPAAPSTDAAPRAETAAPPADPEPVEEAPRVFGRVLGQVHSRYIVAETADGLAVVDQHAAHERIVHERLKARLAAGPLPAQRLLVPEVLPIGGRAAAALVEARDLLSVFGFEIEDAGDGRVRLTARPDVLAGTDMTETMARLGEAVETGGAEDVLRDRIERVCAEAACKRAIKAGDRLGEAAMNELLRQMETTPNAIVCNHGRPTVFTLSLGDLDRLFERT